MNYKRRGVQDYRDGKFYESPTQTTENWTDGGDEFIVPYHPWAVLFFKTHVNVEVS